MKKEGQAGPMPYRSGSRLEQVLTAGHFAVTAEVGLVRGCDAGRVRDRARRIKGLADAYNLTDNQTAVARLSSLGGAGLLIAEGLEPVFQMNCRDRNRIALQSDLLGAAALGVKNCLCITGDHPRAGASARFRGNPETKNVFDVDSLQLLQIIRGLRDEGKFQNGEPLDGDRPAMFLGAAWSPLADPREFRTQRLAKKISAGADFIQTQAVFDVPEFKRWMERARDAGLADRVHILAGVLLPAFAGMLRGIQKRVPGISVPDHYVKRMEQTKDEFEEAIRITVELIEQLREVPGLAGVHIQTIEVEDRLPPVVERAGLLPRPEINN
jgi:5,10-methylenetetrahydrofolate reductase